MGKVDELEPIVNDPFDPNRRWALAELCKIARKGGTGGAKAYKIIGKIARDPFDSLRQQALDCLGE